VSDVIISVEGLGKKYRISHQTERPRYGTLRDVIAGKAKRLFARKEKSEDRDQKSDVRDPVSEDFWALKDVSFQLKQGEVVGIIGRNGAGKSTLLKILSRITEPTKGRIHIKGRMASLLEVGTGFHPELTGRENIFLNGAILGMSRLEIKKKFDEIVSFAEVGKFLDTPVKRYSSGMYVRLAFAIAAHLEPEILIVDEVLAVGDADFQRKCLGKMGEVAKEGRTILFVSHNIVAVQTLCTRGLLFNQGSVQQDGETKECIEIYCNQTTGGDRFKRPSANGKAICIMGARLRKLEDAQNPKLLVQVDIRSNRACELSLDMRLTERAGLPAGFGSLGAFNPEQLISLQEGPNGIAFSFPLSSLANGSYVISLDLTFPTKEYLERADRCLSFEYHRPVPPGSKNIMSQSWGYGSFRIAMHREDMDGEGQS
jgi:lipopolysaccharide transport system ATP-binding protein